MAVSSKQSLRLANLRGEMYPDYEIENSHTGGSPKQHASSAPCVDEDHCGDIHGNKDDILNGTRNEIGISSQTSHVKDEYDVVHL